jgi:DNA repair exonuclease SbcCD nuclease subunit
MKTIIISDIHLGSPVCRADKVLDILNSDMDELIINGDLIDSKNLTRFRSKHWEILSKLRKLTKKIPTHLIGGNHDGDLGQVSDMLGLDFRQSMDIKTDNFNAYVTHGDKFDLWMSLRGVSDFFSGLYYYVQRIDSKSRRMSRFIKRLSKKLIKTDSNMANKACRYASKHGYDTAILGHSHFADDKMIDGVRYLNSGSFCEDPCHFIEVSDCITLKEC